MPKSTVDIFEQLMRVNEQSVASIESRTAKDIEEQLSGIEKKFVEAEQITDDKVREARQKILQADFKTLAADANQEEDDLAKAVFGLNGMLEKMGEEYANLGSPNADDQALIARADKKLEEAKQSLVTANGKFMFKASAIAKANQAIISAEAGIKQAHEVAKHNARQRLMKADMEASLQEFQVRVQKTIQIMEDRMQQISEQLQAVTARKDRAFTVKEAAAEALESLEAELNEVEASLRAEEEALESQINGTAEHSVQTQKVSNLRAKVEDVRGKRNTAFVLYQSKEKFSNELEIHERTQMKLRDNQRMWITSLRSDTEERVVTFKSRLEAMKAAADQEIAKNLDDLGAEVDQHNAEYMARVGSASDRLRMDKIEAHPQRIADIVKVQEAQAEAVSAIRQREAKAIAEFKEKYGIDPSRSSFFHYTENQPV